MRIGLVLYVIWLSVRLSALNVYPIPESIYANVQVSAAYKTTIMSSLAITGGALESTIPSLEIGVGIGKPMNGFDLVINTFRAGYVQQTASNAFHQTDATMTAFLLRYYRPLLVDKNSTITGFASFGPYSLEYRIHDYTESSGSTAYKQRTQSGYLGEVGLVFSYSLNPTWQLFLAAGYQLNNENGRYDPVGNPTDDSAFSLRGASFSVGSMIEL